MECGLGFQDLVHNFGHFITSVLHNFGSALYWSVGALRNIWPSIKVLANTVDFLYSELPR